MKVNVIKYGRTNVTDEVTGLPTRIQFGIEASADQCLVFSLYAIVQENANSRRIKWSTIFEQEDETKSRFCFWFEHVNVFREEFFMTRT